MSKEQHRRASDISDNLVDAIVATNPNSKSLKPGKHTEQFLRLYYADVPHDDMQGRSPVIMGQAAVSHLDFARTRRPDVALLRIFNPEEKNTVTSPHIRLSKWSTTTCHFWSIPYLRQSTARNLSSI